MNSCVKRQSGLFIKNVSGNEIYTDLSWLDQLKQLIDNYNLAGA